MGSWFVAPSGDPSPPSFPSLSPACLCPPPPHPPPNTLRDSRSPLPVLQVVRLSSQDVPTAYAYELEAATIVQPEQVVAAVQRVVGQKVAA